MSYFVLSMAVMNYLNVRFSGLITCFWEERTDFSAINYS